MKLELKQVAAASLIVLLLGTGVTACSPSSSASSHESVQVADPEGPALQKMVDDFYRQIAADTQSRDSSIKRPGMTEQEGFAQDFKGSLAYIKPGSMTQLESRKMLVAFARLYAVDPEATVVAAPEDFVVNGNTAYIKSGRLKVTTKGKLQPSYDDADSTTLSFERVDAKWLVSNFNTSG